jgi:hypothetical protein
MERSLPPEYWLTRLFLQRGLAFIYLIGFLIVANQFVALTGVRGVVPAHLWVTQVSFWEAPSFFWFQCTDRVFVVCAWVGVILSVLALFGLSELHGNWVSLLTWSLLWALYLSFVNVGEVFYGFGWEMLLLEVGFLAIFLGPKNRTPPSVVIWLMRWILFRLMFGAGMIKLHGDPCWRDLTCMFYHYETQPLPNPLSWYFHWLPSVIHKAAVLYNHLVELIIPWGFFLPRPFCYWAGGITILFHYFN